MRSRDVPIGRAAAGRPHGSGRYEFFARSPEWLDRGQPLESSLERKVRATSNEPGVRSVPLLGVQDDGSWVIAHRLVGVANSRDPEVAAQLVGPIPASRVSLAEMLRIEDWEGFSDSLKGPWWENRGYQFADLMLDDLLRLGFRRRRQVMANCQPAAVAKAVSALLEAGQARGRLRFRSNHIGAWTVWNEVCAACEVVPPSLLRWVTSFSGWSDRPDMVRVVILDEHLTDPADLQDAQRFTELPDPPDVLVQLIAEAKRAVDADPEVDLVGLWGSPQDSRQWLRAVERELTSGIGVFSSSVDPVVVVDHLTDADRDDLVAQLARLVKRDVDLVPIATRLRDVASDAQVHAIREAATDLIFEDRRPEAFASVWRTLVDGLPDPQPVDLTARKAEELAVLLIEVADLQLVEDVIASVVAERVVSTEITNLLAYFLEAYACDMGGPLSDLLAEPSISSDVFEVLVGPEVPLRLSAEQIHELLVAHSDALGERLRHRGELAAILKLYFELLKERVRQDPRRRVETISELDQLALRFADRFPVRVRIALQAAEFDEGAAAAKAVVQEFLHGTSLGVSQDEFFELILRSNPKLAARVGGQPEHSSVSSSQLGSGSYDPPTRQFPVEVERVAERSDRVPAVSDVDAAWEDRIARLAAALKLSSDQRADRRMRAVIERRLTEDDQLLRKAEGKVKKRGRRAGPVTRFRASRLKLKIKREFKAQAKASPQDGQQLGQDRLGNREPGRTPSEASGLRPAVVDMNTGQGAKRGRGRRRRRRRSRRGGRKVLLWIVAALAGVAGLWFVAMQGKPDGGTPPPVEPTITTTTTTSLGPPPVPQGPAGIDPPEAEVTPTDPTPGAQGQIGIPGGGDG
jgi:hypothetical protein